MKEGSSFKADYCQCGGACNRHGYCKYCGKVSKLTAKSLEDFKNAVKKSSTKKF